MLDEIATLFAFLSIFLSKSDYPASHTKKLKENTKGVKKNYDSAGVCLFVCFFWGRH